MERAVLLTEGDDRHARVAARKTVGTRPPEPSFSAQGVPTPAAASGELAQARHAAARRAFIRAALRQDQGNRTRAAELLEISHRALLYKIKDYGIDPDAEGETPRHRCEVPWVRPIAHPHSLRYTTYL